MNQKKASTEKAVNEALKPIFDGQISAPVVKDTTWQTAGDKLSAMAESLRDIESRL